jgi:phospholipid/cholesterol/gamma-HCH transport system substrate-binding protein
MSQARSRSTLGLAVVLAATAAFAVVFANLPSKWLGPSGETVKAVFADAQQIHPGDPVRVGGVDAGRVSGLTLNNGGRSATVSMVIYHEAQPVYANARAWIAWRSLLGANFVVDLNRGDPAAGALRPSTIPITQTSSQVLLEDLTNTLRTAASAGLRSTLREIPRALTDPTAPARLLSAVAQNSGSLAAGLGAVRGNRPADLQALVSAAARTTHALAESPPALRELVQGAAATLQTTALHAADLRAIIDRTAAISPSVVLTLLQTDQTLRQVNPLVAQLTTAAPEVPASVSALRGTATRAASLLDRAHPLVRSLRPAVASLASAATNGLPVVNGLLPSLGRLNDRILPDLAQVSPETKHTTYQMIGPTFTGLEGALAFFDGENNFVRFPASVSEQSIDTAPCRTYITNATRGAQQLIDCKALIDLMAKLLSFPARVP